MKFGLFLDSSARTFAGIVVGETVIPADSVLSSAATAAESFGTLLRLPPEERMALDERARRLADSDGVGLADVTVLPPYLDAARIMCQVVNYVDHSSETKIRPPSAPFFFTKPPTAVIGTGASILLHPASAKADYEVELAVIIGREGRNISLESAMSHVAGYLIVNDVSYRDLQFNERAPDLNKWFGRNWTKGKGLDGSCVLGPWVTGTEEIADPYALRLQCSVNGAIRQDALAGEMLIRIPELIVEAALGATLRPGDIISTGTPGGVGLSDGRFLDAGDEVEGRIDGLGVIKNRAAVAP